MSQRRDSPISRESDAEIAEGALRTLARLLGRQAARETFAIASSPECRDPAAEPPASHQERTPDDHR